MVERFSPYDELHGSSPNSDENNPTDPAKSPQVDILVAAFSGRGSLCERSADCLGLSIDDLQQDSSGPVRHSAMLFPVLHRIDRKAEPTREL